MKFKFMISEYKSNLEELCFSFDINELVQLKEARKLKEIFKDEIFDPDFYPYSIKFLKLLNNND